MKTKPKFVIIYNLNHVMRERILKTRKVALAFAQLVGGGICELHTK